MVHSSMLFKHGPWCSSWQSHAHTPPKERKGRKQQYVSARGWDFRQQSTVDEHEGKLLHSTHTHTHSLTHTHTHSLTHLHTHTHTRTHTPHTHTHLHTHRRTHTHAHTHPLTHLLTYTRTHTQPHLRSFASVLNGRFFARITVLLRPVTRVSKASRCTP